MDRNEWARARKTATENGNGAHFRDVYSAILSLVLDEETFDIAGDNRIDLVC